MRTKQTKQANILTLSLLRWLFVILGNHVVDIDMMIMEGRMTS